MSRYTGIVGNNNVEYRHEESDLPLFTKNVTRNADGSVRTISYTAVQPTPEIIQAIKDGVEGYTNGIWYHLLVRHGFPGKCGYYPLPLLFSDEARREKLARDRGTEPPKQSWIDNRRNAVIETYSPPQEAPKSHFLDLVARIGDLFRNIRLKAVH